jgi:hypothetical protein
MEVADPGRDDVGPDGERISWHRHAEAKMIFAGTSVGLDRITCPTEVRREEEPTTGVVVVRHEWEVSPGNVDGSLAGEWGRVG